MKLRTPVRRRAPSMHTAIDNFSGDRRRTYAVESTSPRHNHLNSADSTSFLSQFASASRNGDCARCLESISRLSAILMDDRNRSRLASSGAACVLATAFRSFAGGGSGTEPVLMAILAELVLFFPIYDEEVFLEIGSPESLDSIVSILKYGDSSGKLNALLLLKEIVCFDGELARAAARIDGLIEALMSLIRVPISHRDGKTSLLATFHLVVSADEWVAKSFVKMGLVDLIIEFIVVSKSERKMSEKALAAFDRLCGCAEGREKAYENALTVPVLVVRMFGISDLATEFAVSSLWKLCKNWKGGEENGEMVGCVVEALQYGVFLKLLMLLQVECSKVARESATELLKFLKNYGTGLECIDTMDFRGLRRLSD